MSKIKLTGDTSGYVEISAPNVAANNTLELGGGTKILTNLDNVFTGVTTYSGNIDLNANLDLDDNNKLLLGTGDDLQIYHDGTHSHIREVGTGDLRLRSSKIQLMNENSQEYFVGTSGGSVELFHSDVKKFETTGVGITVYGTTQTQQLNITGVTTASSFVGSGNVGVQTSSITHSALVGAGNSFVGMYIGDGSLVFNKYLNRTGGYYISTEVNALNAGPVSLGSTMTLDGTWVIV